MSNYDDIYSAIDAEDRRLARLTDVERSRETLVREIGDALRRARLPADCLTSVVQEFDRIHGGKS
jgi:hypothetical protein